MRVVSWNVNRARTDSPVWDYLFALNPDVVLLQEIGSLPPKINNEFEALIRPAVKASSTGVLVKGNILGPIHLSTRYPWVNRELSSFDGHLVACEVKMNNGDIVNVMSVHSPAWKVNPARLAGIDVSPIARTFNKKANREVWVNDLLWAALRDNFSAEQRWIVGGDFNTCETLRGSSPEFVNRMRGLGFTECLRPSPADPIIPTFRHSSGRIGNQIDYLWISPNFHSQLDNCVVGDRDAVFYCVPKRLSDHLPIIADFH